MCLGIQLIVSPSTLRRPARHGIRNSLAETTLGDEGKRAELGARVKDDEAALKQTGMRGEKRPQRRQRE